MGLSVATPIRRVRALGATAHVLPLLIIFDFIPQRPSGHPPSLIWAINFGATVVTPA